MKCSGDVLMQRLPGVPGRARPLAAVLVALPDLRNERGLRAVLVDLLEQLHPVDLTVLDLQPFAIHILGISQMQVCREGKNLIEKVSERQVQMVAGELGMRHIQADPHPLLLAEAVNEAWFHEKVVKALSTEMPGKRRHRLRNDLHIAAAVQPHKAFDQPLLQGIPFVAIEMAVFGEASDIGHQQHGVRAAEARTQIPEMSITRCSSRME